MTVRVLNGDSMTVLQTLPDESVNCIVTSPPYWGLRDYGMAGQMGLESTPAGYVDGMVTLFREARRVLRDDGTLWLNLGDSYASGGRGGGMAGERGEKQRSNEGALLGPKRAPEGLKDKDLVGIPWRVAFALQADGWYLRQDIIWAKPNPMPESVTDRCTKAHEYIFLLAKSARYYFDAEAISEQASGEARGGGFKAAGAGHTNLSKCGEIAYETRNKRDVWTVATQPYSEAHFATFPPALIEPCILAGCPTGGVVLDTFGGAGTTGLVADRHGRDAILIELNPEYADMARKRITNDSPLFAEVA